MFVYNTYYKQYLFLAKSEYNNSKVLVIAESTKIAQEKLKEIQDVRKSHGWEIKLMDCINIENDIYENKS